MAYLYQPSSAIGDTSAFTYVGWFRHPSIDTFGNPLFTVSDGGNRIQIFISHLFLGHVFYQAFDGSAFLNGISLATITEGSWYFMGLALSDSSSICVVNNNFSIDATNWDLWGGGSFRFSGSAVGVPWNGDGSLISTKTTEMAFVRMWPYFIDIQSNYSKLVKITGSTGTPAPWASANNSFGAPAIAFKGGATTFDTNLGTAGAFIKAGTVSDFTPGPSFA